MIVFAATSALLMMAGVTPEPKLDCTDPVTQTAMTMCAVQGFEEADRALNAQWKITSAGMKERDRETGADDGRPSYHQALLTAQRAWLRYRDAHCMSAGFYARGGSMEPMLVALCRTELTIERTKKLNNLTGQ